MNTFVIDDDPVSRLALSELVRRFELGPGVEFESADEAWTHLQTQPAPMLICCDVRMPGMSGIEFLAKVKWIPELARIPFVLVTSATERDVVHEAIQLGAAGYVVKPFSVDEARQRLGGILAHSWKEIAEDPATTARRLGIVPSKLHTYYSAFRRQIEEGQAALSGNPNATEVAQRIDALQTGCLTLGLWHAARIFDRLKFLRLTPHKAREHLVAVGDSLELQRKGVREAHWKKVDLPQTVL